MVPSERLPPDLSCHRIRLGSVGSQRGADAEYSRATDPDKRASSRSEENLLVAHQRRREASLETSCCGARRGGRVCLRVPPTNVIRRAYTAAWHDKPLGSLGRCFLMTDATLDKARL